MLAWVILTALVFLRLVAQSYTRERDLGGAQMAARILATSPALHNADIAALRALASSLLQPGFAVSAFIVSDAKGYQLVNTALPARRRQPCRKNGPPACSARASTASHA